MNISVPEDVARALDALECAGYEAYVVGGCVRDAMLGLVPHDWDVTTAAKPEDIERVFADERILETGLRHGTVTLLTEHRPIEITAFRAEGTYSDGRRPDAVTFVDDVHVDLLRRDFTVNAMAYSPRRGLRDDFGGADDLADGLLRCVGNADERLTEDALRILRALRFTARFGFTVDADTDRALRAHRERLQNVSAERIFSELSGILTAPGAGTVSRSYPEIIFEVIPELAGYGDFDETCRALDASPPELSVRLAVLLRDCDAGAVLRRLRTSTALREDVTALTANLAALPCPDCSALRRLCIQLGDENLSRLFALRKALFPSEEAALRENERLLTDSFPHSIKELSVGGQDLLALGIGRGPALGQMLQRLLIEVIDEILPNERDALLRRVNQIKEDFQ